MGKPVTIKGWPAGINNVKSDTETAYGSLRDALNVDLSESGKPRRRTGRTQVYSGSDVRGLYSALGITVFMEGGDLKRLLPDYSAVVLKSGMHPSNDISYTLVNNEIFFTNSVETGRITATGEVKPCGVATPRGQPLISAASGSMPAGAYQVAVTFVSADGEESGAAKATVFELTVDGGLQLDAIPQNTDAASVRIYVTEPEGDMFREAVTIPMGVTSYMINGVSQGLVLETQFAYELPPGNIIRYYRGRVYVVSGRIAWYSEALYYGVYKPAENFFVFAADVTVFEPVDDGIYVVAEVAFFLAGDDPKKMQQQPVHLSQGIEGTGLTVDAALVMKDAVGQAAYWYGNAGAMLGMRGGQVVPLMENRVALPAYEKGATMLREHNGIRQLVTALYGSGETSSFTMGDEASVEVIRNGIVI